MWWVEVLTAKIFPAKIFSVHGEQMGCFFTSTGAQLPTFYMSLICQLPITVLCWNQSWTCWWKGPCGASSKQTRDLTWCDQLIWNDLYTWPDPSIQISNDAQWTNLVYFTIKWWFIHFNTHQSQTDLPVMSVKNAAMSCPSTHTSQEKNHTKLNSNTQLIYWHIIQSTWSQFANLI